MKIDHSEHKDISTEEARKELNSLFDDEIMHDIEFDTAKFTYIVYTDGVIMKWKGTPEEFSDLVAD